MDYDLALRETKPAALTNTSIAEERLKFEKWHKANRMSIMVMKMTTSETVKGGIQTITRQRIFSKLWEQNSKCSRRLKWESS